MKKNGKKSVFTDSFDTPNISATDGALEFNYNAYTDKQFLKGVFRVNIPSLFNNSAHD